VTPSHIAGTPPATCAVARNGRDGALDDVGIGLIGLMRRQHVVIGGNDGEVGRVAVFQRCLVAGTAGGEAVGDIGAAQAFARGALVGRFVDALQIDRTMIVAALDEAGGHLADPGMHGHGALLTLQQS
jgi:hypothetical protein